MSKAQNDSNAWQSLSFDYGFYYYDILFRPGLKKFLTSSSGQKTGVKTNG